MSEASSRWVLLDENVDRQLVPLFATGLEVRTVREQGWSGLKNGALLRVAAEVFDVFVTMDRNLPHQQNLAALDLVEPLADAGDSGRNLPAKDGGKGLATTGERDVVHLRGIDADRLRDQADEDVVGAASGAASP